MICPACKHETNAVVTTAKYPSVNIRKLRCSGCGFVWSTMEMHVDHETILTNAYRLTKNFPADTLAQSLSAGNGNGG